MSDIKLESSENKPEPTDNETLEKKLKTKLYFRTYYDNNKDKFKHDYEKKKESKKKYYEEHKEERKQYQKKRYEETLRKNHTKREHTDIDELIVEYLKKRNEMKDVIKK